MSKLAVITGGTRGIGKAIIQRFAKEKFTVATCSRSKGELNSLKKEIESGFNVALHTVVADLSVKADVDRFVKSVLGLKKNVDVLVNNAGYFISGEVTTEKEGALEEMIGANLYSAYRTTRGFVGAMRKKKSGHIFNMCSVASMMAYPDGGSYSISKFGLLGFTKALRQELANDGIRVTAVLPGATRTASWDGTKLPEKRFMKPEDIAEAVYSAYRMSPRTVVEEIVLRPQEGDI